VKLLQWINEVREHVVGYGMDTVFRIASLNNNIIRDLLSEWSLCKYKVWIDGWVEQLQTGVQNDFGYLQPACPYDLQNLKWSSKFLMNSISPSFVNMIEPEIDASPTGPMVFYKIMNKVQMMSAEAMRKLEKELQRLVLKQEPGRMLKPSEVKYKELQKS